MNAGAPLSSLTTPALLLDPKRMRRNIAAMHARALRHNVALRPHIKTAKCVPIAREMIAGQAGGVTVSTVAEARAMMDAGIADITYAVGISANKLAAIGALQGRGAHVKLLCDDAGTAAMLGEQGAAMGQLFEVLVEIDCGYGRSGVSADSAALVDIAQRLNKHKATRFGGVLTHAGHSYSCRSIQEIELVAAQERDVVTAAAAHLRLAGVACPTVSAGSTPTAVAGKDWTGVDELRPGNFVLFDLAQAEIGSCAVDDIAVSVLATVISHNPARNGATIDAGSLGLSPDSSVASSIGYGLVCDLDQRPVEGVVVDKLSQEHGWLGSRLSKFPYDLLPIGSLVRVLPAHSCITAAQHVAFDVVEQGRVTATWPRVRGW